MYSNYYSLEVICLSALCVFKCNPYCGVLNRWKLNTSVFKLETLGEDYVR